jgi:aspartate 1-decarboxylase
MLTHFLKCKIHRATVTDANLHYEGSISIDNTLMEAAGIVPFEKVHIYNISNGERFETYAIRGEKGVICLNGAAAWKAKATDKIIIASYCLLEESEVRDHQPTIVLVKENNEIKSVSRDAI